jgi:hypothetical protein
MACFDAVSFHEGRGSVPGAWPELPIAANARIPTGIANVFERERLITVPPPCGNLERRPTGKPLGP